MKLHTLVQDLVKYGDIPAIPIAGLSLYSNRICPGELFIAVKGQFFDGRAYIHHAIARGASAVICEAQGLQAFAIHQADIPIIAIDNLSKKLPLIAKRFYGDPSQTLEITGVTGTNGKTTTCYLLAQCLNHLGVSCGVIGTLGYGFIPDLNTDCSLTTPDVISLQKYLCELKTQGAQTIAMEVSSHGLAQNRVNSIPFSSAMFTNLTQDHLDYHGNMQDYGNAKQKLFQFASLKRVILNADQVFTQKIIQHIVPAIRVVLYSVNPTIPDFSSSAPYLTITVKHWHCNEQGLRAWVETPWGIGELRSSLLGEFNLSNLLGVLAELCLQGFAFKDALEALSHAQSAPGRMQSLGTEEMPQIIVDYAHTPDALEKALLAARLHCQGRLWCVFGCGGDRDKDKRAKMGKIASDYADNIVLTSDNPRTENPQQILHEIQLGIDKEQITFAIEENRKEAIHYAIARASAQDTILIAGKGHENYQIIGDKKLPFSDIEQAKAALKIKGSSI